MPDRRVTTMPGDIRHRTEAKAAERRGVEHPHAAVFRPYRNGLPGFRPYVYQGAGYDIYENRGAR